MDDKTLLELAAKAAGLKGLHERAGKLCYTTSDGHGGSLMWNPLEDDGDALRLAVKLYLLSSPVFYHYLALERLKTDDERKATRRAIVRAAAAIGESM